MLSEPLRCSSAYKCALLAWAANKAVMRLVVSLLMSISSSSDTACTSGKAAQEHHTASWMSLLPLHSLLHAAKSSLISLSSSLNPWAASTALRAGHNCPSGSIVPQAVPSMATDSLSYKSCQIRTLAAYVNTSRLLEINVVISLHWAGYERADQQQKQTTTLVERSNSTHLSILRSSLVSLGSTNLHMFACLK